MKKSNWFEIILIVVVMSVSLYAALSDPQNLSMRWFIRDDAYYYYKVAQNISEGHGSTFDGINLSNGYHPLWLWVCIPIFALARFDLILPLRILILVLGALSAGTAILLYRLIRKVFTPALGAIAAIYWAFDREILMRMYKQGLETGIVAFFIVLFIYKLFEFEKNWRTQKATTKQIAILGIVGILVVFSRLDLIFLVALAGVGVIFRKSPMRYLLPLDVMFIFTSVLLALIHRVTFDKYLKFSDAAVVMIAVSLAIKLAGAYIFGLYQRTVLKDKWRLVKQTLLFGIVTSALVGAIMILIAPYKHFEGFPRTVIFYDLIITVLFFLLSRLGIEGIGSNIATVKDEPSPIQQLMENWKQWLSDTFAYYGIVLGSLGAYMIWSKIVFGTFSPVSGQIKRWWGSLSGKVYGGPAQTSIDFFGLTNSGDGSAWYPVSAWLSEQAKFLNQWRIGEWSYIVIIGVFALIYYAVLYINKQKARSAITQFSLIPLLAGAWIQVLSYHMTGYSAYKEWYWVIQPILIILALSLLAGMFYQLIKKYSASRVFLWLVAAGTGFVMGTGYWNYIEHVMPYNKTPADTPYNDIAAYLEETTPPGSIIGMTGGGNAGYFIKDRTVVNMDGLINSNEYFQLLKERKAGEYMVEIGMNYILANVTMLEQLPYKRQFGPYIRYINERYGGKELMYYSNEPQ